MKIKTLDTCIKFHIPRYYWDGTRMKRIPRNKFKQFMLSNLKESYNIFSYYEYTINATYKDRNYKEDIIVVYCDFYKEEAITNSFIEDIKLFSKVLNQESYAFEVNNKLEIFTV